jgi:hypothetical protein
MKDTSNNNSSLYFLLICFVIFLIVKNTYDATLDVLYPLYEDIENGNSTVKKAFILRNILSIMCVTFILFLFLNYKLNKYLYVILSIVLLTCISFFLFCDRFIFYFIKQNKRNLDIVKFIDAYGSMALNYILLMYSLFIIIQIFRT